MKFSLVVLVLTICIITDVLAKESNSNIERNISIFTGLYYPQNGHFTKYCDVIYNEGISYGGKITFLNKVYRL